MGIFDRFISPESKTVSAYTPSSEQEAWISIMYACISVDGHVTEIERNKLCELIVFKTLFKGQQVIELYKKAVFTCTQHGSKHVIEKSAGIIKEEDRATLFTLCMELVLSDGTIGATEKEIIEYLSSSLYLDEILVNKIVEVMMIRNKGSIITV